MIPIDRTGGDAAQRALDIAADILGDGELFGIYPEGTRSRDGVLHKGRTGAARLALRTGAPLLPVGIGGTRDIQPPGASVPRPFRSCEFHIGRRSTGPVRRAGRRPAGAAPDHRRGDVRDPPAVGAGLRRRVRGVEEAPARAARRGHRHRRRLAARGNGHRQRAFESLVDEAPLEGGRSSADVLASAGD